MRSSPSKSQASMRFTAATSAMRLLCPETRKPMRRMSPAAVHSPGPAPVTPSVVVLGAAAAAAGVVPGGALDVVGDTWALILALAAFLVAGGASAKRRSAASSSVGDKRWSLLASIAAKARLTSSAKTSDADAWKVWKSSCSLIGPPRLASAAWRTTAGSKPTGSGGFESLCRESAGALDVATSVVICGAMLSTLGFRHAPTARNTPGRQENFRKKSAPSNSEAVTRLSISESRPMNA
mmetsp:Transcript_89200/g.257182  ORF Transcript_89200/g.257182 Transcript_89200/m.257182 type:complete len:238 (+) Transcript_89200:280-993(+)